MPARIVQMHPADYLASVAPLTIDDVTGPYIANLYFRMKQGETFDMPKIYADGSEDGRHRATAAFWLGLKSIPVMVYG